MLKVKSSLSLSPWYKKMCKNFKFITDVLITHVWSLCMLPDFIEDVPRIHHNLLRYKTIPPTYPSVETLINIVYLLSTYACLHHFIYDRSASIKCTYWFIIKKLTSSHYKVTKDKIFFPTLKMVSDVFDMQIFNNQYICTMNDENSRWSWY